MGNFYIVKPKPITNYLKDPSFESWGRLGGAPAIWTRSSVATAPSPSAGNGWRGIFGCSIVESEYVYQEVTLPSTGVAYTASVWVYVEAGTVTLKMCDATTEANAVTSTSTETGKWVRLSVSATRASAATRIKISAGTGALGSNTVYCDAVQVELGNLSDYCDGDEPDCRWNGMRFLKTSSRGDTRMGGERVELDNGSTIGCEIFMGTGGPDVETQYEPNPELPGGTYKLVRDDQRTMVLQLWAAVEDDSTTPLEDLHALRATLTELIQPGSESTNPEPFLLVYTGNTADLVLKAHYVGGLGGTIGSQYFERITLTMVSDGPYWEEEREVCVALDTGQSLTPQRAIARINGVWGQLGGAPDAQVWDTAYSKTDGALYICGAFANLGAVAAVRCGRWTGEAWEAMSLPAGTYVTVAIAIAPNGYPYVADYNTGTNVTTIKYWDGSSWTSLGVTLTGVVYAIGFNDYNQLFVAGDFANRIARWTGAAWDYPPSAPSMAECRSIAFDDRKIYFSGFNGTTPYVYEWHYDSDLSIDTLTDITGDLSSEVYRVMALVFYQGVLWAGCEAPDTAQGIIWTYNGDQWLAVPGMPEIPQVTTYYSGVSDMTIVNGVLYFTFLDNLYFYSGSSANYFDADLEDAEKIAVNEYGDVFVTQSTLTSVDLSTSQTVDSEGTAAVRPRFVSLSYNADGLRAIWNESNYRQLHVDRIVGGTNEVEYDLELGGPKSKFTGTWIWNGGSDIGAWTLEPGENLLAVYSTIHTDDLYMLWKPKHWSMDL